MTIGKIGIFDSGYGGLTILKDIRKNLPQYDYVYLGDNARAPYGSRSFDIVYQFTLQAVETLFKKNCNLVILACNTASAKALRTIQQNDLKRIGPDRRVLGVIRPTVEILDSLSRSKHVGILATPGTINSHSYQLETKKLFPNIEIEELACPMWVPLVENGEANNPGADYFVEKYITQILNADPKIDTLVLGCTHYPILLQKIKKFTPDNINIVAQGNLIAESLKDYLQRHPEMDNNLSKNNSVEFFTTENPQKFNSLASLFLDHNVNASHINIS